MNPGKRLVVDIPFDNVIDKQYLSACGLDEIGAAGVGFDVTKYDGDADLCSGKLDITIKGAGGKFSDSGAEVYNKNGVRIISKGLFGGEYDRDDNYYLILLAENSSDRSLTIADEYNSLSVNGYMTDYYCGSAELEPGETQFLKIRIDTDSLAENGIKDLSGITDAEFSISIYENGYNKIGSDTVKITF